MDGCCWTRAREVSPSGAPLRLQGNLGPPRAGRNNLSPFKEQTFYGPQHHFSFRESLSPALEEDCFPVTSFPFIPVVGGSLVPQVDLVRRESTSQCSRRTRNTRLRGHTGPQLGHGAHNEHPPQSAPTREGTAQCFLQLDLQQYSFPNR